ncbi:hypothetical protein [Brevundimonas sp.]|uniref:hypothetical protein n=1 Tax=Brevundimonas sp. TaxID=1871086 RepID=UPI001AD38969|nr:hypothetical protein [Brevundimonas sp.]MBN9466652.1 hypothetical protein [Brevundimonas sp.]
MNRFIRESASVIILAILAIQAGCASAHQVASRDVKVVILNANVSRSSLIINQAEIHQGALSVVNESDGVSLIVSVGRSNEYDVEFAYEESRMERIFPDGRNIEIIYIDVGKVPQITASANPNLLLD